LIRDLRLAARTLFRNKTFSATAIIVLALGLAVNNTLFTIVNAICIRGLPIVSPERMIYIATRDAQDRERGLSFAEFQDARAVLRSVEGLAAFNSGSVSLGDEQRAAGRFNGASISGNLFQLIREEPIWGRGITPDDEKAGAPPVVVIGFGVWQERFGADPAIIGKIVRVNGVAVVVVGVMRRGFKFPNNADLWQPLVQQPGILAAPRTARTLAVIGRLVAASTQQQARAEIEAFGGTLRETHRDTNPEVRFTSVPINERYSPRVTDPNWMAFIAVGIVSLLIACANVANLFLSRSIGRMAEFAVRVSLGSSPANLARHLFLEAMVIVTAAATVAMALSWGATRLFAAAQIENAMPYWVQFTMDFRVTLVLVAASFLAMLAVGIIPAVIIARKDLAPHLREGGRSGMLSGTSRRWTATVLVAEFALTIVLLSYVALTIRNIRSIERADAVVDSSNVLTMWVSLPAQKYATPESRVHFLDSVRNRFSVVPGVVGVTIASALPFSGASSRLLTIDGAEPNRSAPTVWSVGVDPAYFETLRIPLIGGRAFALQDGRPGNENVIVNQKLVSTYFPDGDVVGKRIKVLAEGQKDGPWLTIVGVSPSVRQRAVVEPDAVVYVPLLSGPAPVNAITIRASQDPSLLTSMLRDQLRALDADLPLYRVQALSQVISDSRFGVRLSGIMITVIAVIAVIMASIGLYAVTSHAVRRRTQEIGVRMALGATASSIGRLVVRTLLVQLALGLAAGVALTWIWQQAFLDGSIPDRHLASPFVVGPVSLLLAAVALLGCAVPLLRASRVDPVIALRSE
jgi:predicted permease